MVTNIMSGIRINCAAGIFLLLGMVPLAAWGQGLSDPTRPPYGLGTAGSLSAMSAYPQKRGLQSVMISPKHCAAIIDGKTLALGAMHGSERLVEISENGVVLQGGQGRRALTLFSAVGVKMTEISPLDKPAAKCQWEPLKHTKPLAEQAGQKEKK